MKNKRSILLFIISIFICSVSYGQTNDDIKKQINEIKKNTSKYLYGEATAMTEEDAKECAEEFLYDEINKWATTNKKLSSASDFLINNKQNYVSSLATTRGNMFRCFVYVKKSDISEANNVDIIKNKGVKDETLEPEVVTKPIETPTYPAIVRELAGISDYKTISSKIIAYKANGQIKKYARYDKLDNPEEYYLVIYDKAGSIVAILTPGTSRINICTGEPDGEHNYKGCGAIGFTL